MDIDENNKDTRLGGKTSRAPAGGLRTRGLLRWVLWVVSIAPIDHKLATKSVKCPPSPGRASTPRRSGGAAPWSRRDNTGRLSPEYTPQGYMGPRRGPLGSALNLVLEVRQNSVSLVFGI